MIINNEQLKQRLGNFEKHLLEKEFIQYSNANDLANDLRKKVGIHHAINPHQYKRDIHKLVKHVGTAKVLRV